MQREGLLAVQCRSWSLLAVGKLKPALLCHELQRFLPHPCPIPSAYLLTAWWFLAKAFATWMAVFMDCCTIWMVDRASLNCRWHQGGRLRRSMRGRAWCRQQGKGLVNVKSSWRPEQQGLSGRRLS